MSERKKIHSWRNKENTEKETESKKKRVRQRKQEKEKIISTDRIRDMRRK